MGRVVIILAKKKRQRVPVLDALIDLAGAAALDYIAYNRRKSRGSHAKNKIDTYAAAGIAVGSGLVNNTAEESEVFIYCSVELIDSKEKRYYRTENHALKVGDQVVVPSSVSGSVSIGLIQSIELYTRSTAPIPVEETAIIYGTI